MSNFVRPKERRRSEFNFFGGRTLAVVVITAVAALSFSLGYNVGRSGLEAPGMSDAVPVVPEGAGLVLLGGNNACEENAGNGPIASASGEKSSSVAVLETMKPPSVPQPDPVPASAGSDEPVLEPLRDQNAAETPQTDINQGERRVAPIRQLPAKQAGTASDSASSKDSQREASSQPVPEKISPKVKMPERERSPVTKKKPIPKKGLLLPRTAGLTVYRWGPSGA